mgnify:CR=1 FL=1
MILSYLGGVIVMARADLLCDLIKSGSTGDNVGFRRAAEAICAEERAKLDLSKAFYF